MYIYCLDFCSSFQVIGMKYFKENLERLQSEMVEFVSSVTINTFRLALNSNLLPNICLTCRHYSSYSLSLIILCS